MDSSAQPPGKIRTWWHPLLVNLLRWQLGSHYRLEEEVSVGKKPLQIDILLLQKEQGELPAHARAILAGLVERLGSLTLIEFKGPTDSLGAGDLHTFLAYVLLYRSQNDPFLETSKMHLVVLAPRLTKPFHEELRTLGLTEQEEEKGIWHIQGGVLGHPMWVLETDLLAGLKHPLLTLISPQFLAKQTAVYDILSEAGYRDLTTYLRQQVVQFRSLGKEFTMQHLGTEQEMDQVLKDLLKKLPPDDLWDALSADERLKEIPTEERLKGMPTEERLKGMPTEERLKGIPAEERLKGLSAEELERLRQLLKETSKDEHEP